jgi:hypothetical protein
MTRVTKKPKRAKQSRAERRRVALEAVRQRCADLGIDEAELLRRTRERLELYRQQHRKRSGPPLRLHLCLDLRAEGKPNGN